MGRKTPLLSLLAFGGVCRENRSRLTALQDLFHQQRVMTDPFREKGTSLKLEPQKPTGIHRNQQVKRERMTLEVLYRKKKIAKENFIIS